jgi:Methyltransferase domain
MDIFTAIERCSSDNIRRAVLAGQSKDAIRIDGVTPLILAISLGNTEATHTLLQLGADPTIASSENLAPIDFARGKGNIEIEDALLAALHKHERRAIVGKNVKGTIVSGVARDLQNFLDETDLVLPPHCLERFAGLIRAEVGDERADQILSGLKQTNYRVLFEQLFSPEAQAVAHLSHGFTTIRSPMAIGAYDVPQAVRSGLDVVEAFKEKFEITDTLLWKLLPNHLFETPPSHICEIGGAWGATIAHLTKRFQPALYHNYEPDRHYAEWTWRQFGAKRMPVDGETLSGTPDESMDLVIANNVLIFVPVIKTWSYLVEMRRVLRHGGVILFNAVISDQISEDGLKHYLETSFPKRAINILPRDVIDRTFPKDKFETFPIVDREYCMIRRTM